MTTHNSLILITSAFSQPVPFRYELQKELCPENQASMLIFSEKV